MPAPARTSSEPSRRSTARRCSGVSSAHRSLLQIEGYLQPPFQAQRSGHARRARRARMQRVGLADPRRAPSRASRGTRPASSRSFEYQRSPSSSTSSATMPRGRGSLAAERHVDAAGRSQPEQLLDHQHVERRLEAVLGLPARDLVAVHALAALVVDHERHAVAGRPRGRSGRARAGRRRARPARCPRRSRSELELDGSKRVSRVGLRAQVAQQVELEPARRGAHARLLRRELEGGAALAQLLEQDALGVGRGSRGSRAARRSPRAGARRSCSSTAWA